MKKFVLVLCLIAIPMCASAEWTWVKSIDCSAATTSGARLKDLKADSAGNLYVTTFFGSDTRRIWKVSDTITATTPTVAAFETPAADYNSSNAAALVIDPADNVYLAMDTNDAATSWIKKYSSDGSLDTTFGSSGTLSPVVNGGENRRPRSIGFADAATDKLIVSYFMTPYSLGVLDAGTGADGGALLATLADQNDDESAAEGEIWNGLTYDPVENAIYGNGQADLMKVTGTSASLDDLSTFDTFTMVTSHPRLNNSSNGLDSLLSENLVAYTAVSGSANAIQVGVYNMVSDMEEMAGNDSTSDGYINAGGSCALFSYGGSTYVAAVNYYGNSVEVFVGTSDVTNWDEY